MNQDRTSPRCSARPGSPCSRIPAVITWEGVALLFGSMLVLMSAALAGDDRDLVRSGGGQPYVFFLIDISSSMKRTPGGECSIATADAPWSKLYLAKKAIYEVIDRVGDNAVYGFATYDANQVEPFNKHWIYTPKSDPTWITDPSSPFFGGGSNAPWLGWNSAEVAYPRRGHPLVFGDHSDQDEADPARIKNPQSGSEDDHSDGSCSHPEDLDVEISTRASDPDAETSPLNWTDTRALGQLWTFPKLGGDGSVETVQWFRFRDTVYRLTWFPLAGSQQLGDEEITVRVRLERKSGNNCDDSSMTLVSEEDLVLEPLFPSDLDGDPLSGANDFMAEQDADDCYFKIDDYDEEGACRDDGGAWWNDNFDNVGEPWSYDSTPDPLNRDPVNRSFDRGDMIPFDWTTPDGFTTSNREEILRRLAPNMILPGETVPDFRVSRYYQDTPDSTGLLQLKPEFADYPPIIASGGTPNAGALYQFRKWYDDWSTVAASEDPWWSCRSVHVVLLTDGGESCDEDYGPPLPFSDFCTGATNNACPDGSDTLISQAEILLDGPHAVTNEPRGVKTWVIAFDYSSSRLDDTARAGGTCADRDGDGQEECAFFPTTKDELVESLENVFEVATSGPRTFVPAISPPHETNVTGKVLVSSFQPLLDAPIWDGHLRAFLEPMPLDSNGKPDLTKVCGENDESQCFLWDAGEALLDQAPTETDMQQNPPALRLGGGVSERRLFYVDDSEAEYGDSTTADDVPRPRRLLSPPTESDPEAILDSLANKMGISPESSDVLEEVSDVIEFTIAPKRAEIPDPNDPDQTLVRDYVLGDIFHSEPIVVGPPSRSSYWRINLNDYRAFYLKHRLRRKMLLAGSNDGQLHAFDLGFFEASAPDPEDWKFNHGTGKELFAFVPSAVMPTVRELSQPGAQHEYTVDGGGMVDDFYIDPIHDGTPTVDEREWRTLFLGGLRRGGSAYFAVDITQPDELSDADDYVPSLSSYVPECWDTPVGDTGNCGPLPFPSLLWEFTDLSDEDDIDGDGVSEGNGFPDLGLTWSRPNSGRIRVVEQGEEIQKFVTIFGGGMDPQNLNRQGNFLYILDVETGSILYKRQLEGSAPSEPAAVDLDRDGFLDTIYIGTTRGFLYKVDLSSAAAIDPASGRILDSSWEPFKVFDTEGRPIFYPPSVIHLSRQEGFALAFGTGDRENLFSSQPYVQRFFVLADPNFSRGHTDLPKKADDLLQSDGNLVVSNALSDFGGWYLQMDPEERMVSRALSVAGLTTFSMFSPRSSGGGCSRSGTSRIFVVETGNGSGLLGEDETTNRSFAVDDFVTDSFLRQSDFELRNDASSEGTISDDCSSKEPVHEGVKALLPEECKFSSFHIKIKAHRSDTGQVCVAPIPVCVIQRNWKSY